MALSIRCVAAILICLAVTDSAAGQIIAQWNFGTQDLPGQNTGPQFSPTTANPNLTITDISRGSTTNFDMEATTATGQNNQTYPTAPYNRAFNNATFASEAAGLANDTYWFFTVTPNVGFRLNLTGFSTQVGRGGLGGNRATYIYDSIDGFTEGASITKLETVANDTTLTRPNSTIISASLTAARYQNLTGAITFRAYVVTDGGGQSMDFDDVTLTGSVVAVPEPTALLLTSVAAGAWALVRRARVSRRRLLD